MSKVVEKLYADTIRGLMKDKNINIIDNDFGDAVNIIIDLITFFTDI